MKRHNKFEKAYLKSINLIKEDTEEVAPETASETTPENEVKVITFKTSDPALIDAFTGGFEKITVSKKNGETEELEDIEFVKDLFGDIVVTAEAEVAENDLQENDEVTECDDVKKGDEIKKEDEEITECDDVEESDEIEEEDDEVTECDDVKKGDDCENCQDDEVTECGDVEEDDEVAECNAFESALRRIKQKYLIK